MAWRKARNGNKCKCCSSSSSSSSSGSKSFSSSSSSSSSSEGSSHSSSSSSSSASSSEGIETGTCCGINSNYVVQEYRDEQRSEVEDWLRSQEQGREDAGFIFHGPVWIERDDEWYGALICLGQENAEGFCDCEEMETGLGYVCFDELTPEQCAASGTGSGSGIIVPGTQVFTLGGECFNTQEGSDVAEYNGCDGLIDPCSLGCPTCLPCDPSVLPAGYTDDQDVITDEAAAIVNYRVSPVYVNSNLMPVEGEDFEWLVDMDEEYGGEYRWYVEVLSSVFEVYDFNQPGVVSAFTSCVKYYVIACVRNKSEWQDVTSQVVKGLPKTFDLGLCFGMEPPLEVDDALNYAYVEAYIEQFNDCYVEQGCSFPGPEVPGVTPPDFGEWGDNTFPIDYSEDGTRKKDEENPLP